MRIIILAHLLFAYLATASENDEIQTAMDRKSRGTQETSFSYAATDIGSKSGTRIKTITVIKNVANKKDKPIEIDPKLHKDPNWGEIFKNNFDAFGKIPEIPDIKNVEEFFHKEHNEKSDESSDLDAKAEIPERKEIPIYEEPEPDVIEEKTLPTREDESNIDEAEKEARVEDMGGEQATSSRIIQKLPQDVELIEIKPINFKQAEMSARAQSLHYAGSRTQPRKLTKVEYDTSASQHSNSYKGKDNSKGSFTVQPAQYSTSNIHSQYSQPANYKTAIYTVHPAYPNPSQQSNKSNYPQITTVVPPYIAPRKTALGIYQSTTLKPQGISKASPTPYIAPSIKNAYRLQTSSIKPINSPSYDGNTGSSRVFQVNSSGQRFRGLRY